MTLDDTQRKKVAAWVQDGLKLSEIQNRITSELGLRLTYMEVRFLVDDLKLVPKDIEPKKPAAPIVTDKTPSPAPDSSTPPPKDADEPAAGRAGVSVSVDQLARPGAIVSGKVTFSDGQRATWYLDQSGRLGLQPEQASYRPPAADVQQFQMALEAELSKMGF